MTITEASNSHALPISDALAAYVVHLIWRDVERGWSDRRQLTAEEALQLADRIAAALPEEKRVKLRRPRISVAKEPESPSRAA